MVADQEEEENLLCWGGGAGEGWEAGGGGAARPACWDGALGVGEEAEMGRKEQQGKKGRALISHLQIPSCSFSSPHVFLCCLCSSNLQGLWEANIRGGLFYSIYFVSFDHGTKLHLVNGVKCSQKHHWNRDSLDWCMGRRPGRWPSARTWRRL